MNLSALSHRMCLRLALAAACCAAAAAHAAAPGPVSALETLSIDGSGHPRLRWQPPCGTFSYQVERRSDRHSGGEVACLAGETLTGGWCVLGAVTTMPEALPSTRVVFTDPAVRIDPSDAAEYEYRVKTFNEDGASAYARQWSSNCEILPEDPLGDWLATMKHINGADILAPADITTITTTDGGVHHHKVFWDNYHLLWDDRYIAVFGKYGGLVSLVHRLYGVEFIHSEPSLLKNPWADAWQLRLNQLQSGVDDTRVESNTQEPTVAPTAAGDGIEFTWTNVGGRGIDVVTTWTLQSAGSPGLHGRVRTAGTATGTGGITELRFPVVRGLGYRYADLIWPAGIGMEYTNFPYRNVVNDTLWTPNRAVTGDFLDGLRMQFFGVSRVANADIRAGIYLAAEDPGQVPKGIYIQPHWLDGSVERPAGSSFIHYPLNGTAQPGSAIGGHGDDYDVVLAPLCGGSERIAKRYRHWARQQSWTKAPASAVGGSGAALVDAPTRLRTDINDMVREGVFWWTQDNGPASPNHMADYAQNSLKPLIGPGVGAGGVNVGIHLYNWYSPPYDYNMPAFIQATAPAGSPDPVKDMPDYLAAVQQDGTVVMPYINATMVDITDRCSAFDTVCADPGGYRCPDGLGGTRVCGWFTHEFLPGHTTAQHLLYREKTSATSSDDAVQDEQFGMSISLGRVDLGSAFWQTVMDANVGNVYGWGSTGVYLDTFGSGYEGDYAGLWGITRGRPVGHGTFFRDDSLALAAAVRAKAQAQPAGGKRFNGAEHFNESFIRDIDLFVLYENHSQQTSPMAQLVYSDYQLFGGPQGRESDTPQARAMRYGRAFTWGIQLGMTGVGGLCGIYSVAQCQVGQNADIVQYMRTLAAAREALHSYLSYGEYLGRAEDDSVTLLPGPSGQTATGWCADRNCEYVENAPAPAIRAGRWLSGNGDRAIILTNTAFAASAATVPVPANWRGLSVNCRFADATVDGGCVTANNTSSLQIALPALSVRYITFH